MLSPQNRCSRHAAATGSSGRSVLLGLGLPLRHGAPVSPLPVGSSTCLKGPAGGVVQPLPAKPTLMGSKPSLRPPPTKQAARH